jgi:uncharacterized protein (TIGR00369 family)
MASCATPAMPFDADAARRLLHDVFAPWVQDLALEFVSLGADGVTLRLPHSARLCRDGGVLCGQAMMAAADTAMAVAISVVGGRYRPMTTVDQTTHFQRPAIGTALLVRATVTRLGRTMAFGRVDLTGEADGKPVAAVQTVYALL